MPQQDTNALGRRRIRTDAQALAYAIPSGEVVIKLGKMYSLIMLDLITEFRATATPIPLAKRDEIIARHSKSNGAIIMSQLRDKGALVSGAGDNNRDLDVVPRFNGIVYVNSATQQIIWPPEQAGQSVRVRRSTQPETISRSGEENVLQTNVPSVESISPTLTQEPVTESSPFQIAPGAFVLSPRTPILKMRGARLAVYTGLIGFSRGTKYQPLSHSDVCRFATRSAQRNPSACIYGMEIELGLFVRLSDTKVPGQKFGRAIVIRPYVDADGTVVTPSECFAHPSANDGSDKPAVFEKWPEPSHAQQPPAESSTSHVRSKLELEVEFARLQDELSAKRVERDRTFSERERTREELEKWIREVEEELTKARTEFEEFQSKQDGVDGLTSQIDALDQKKDRLASLIENYDTMIALLLKS